MACGISNVLQLCTLRTNYVSHTRISRWRLSPTLLTTFRPTPLCSVSAHSGWLPAMAFSHVPHRDIYMYVCTDQTNSITKTSTDTGQTESEENQRRRVQQAACSRIDGVNTRRRRRLWLVVIWFVERYTPNR